MNYVINFFVGAVEKYGFWGVVLDFFVICLVLAIGSSIMSTISDRRKQAHGNNYEEFVASIISKTFKTEVMRNILLDNGSDETELDAAFVTTKGVFALECKYHAKKYHPILTGSLNNQVWQVAYGMTMQNPFDQNYKHVKFLEKVIGVRNVYSIVYTSAPFKFKFFGNVRESENEPFVNMLNNERRGLVYDFKGAFSTHRGTKELAQAIEQLPDIYTEEEVEEIKDVIRLRQMNTKERKAYAKRAKAREILRDAD